MSNLRIIGILLGLLGVFLSLKIFRGPRWNRKNFVFSGFISLFLIIVCVDPDTVNIARKMLSLERSEYGRIIALLIGSNMLLWFLVLYFKSVQDRRAYQFDMLVRKLGEEQATAIIEDNEFSDSEIAVLIPAYNEARNLELLLPEIPELIDGKRVSTLVVDDGSSDGTAGTALKAGAWVVENRINRGGGAALRLGYDIIKRAGIPICVTMDGDGQHRPEDITALTRPIIEEKYDIVIGSRVLGRREKDNLFRMAGVYLFSAIISFLLHTKITDSSSGFRAFRMEVINLMTLREDQYHTSELIIDAAKKGMKIGEAPVTIVKRKFGKSKKGKDWKYGINFAKIIITTWWRQI